MTTNTKLEQLGIGDTVISKVFLSSYYLTKDIVWTVAKKTDKYITMVSNSIYSDAYTIKTTSDNPRDYVFCNTGTLPGTSGIFIFLNLYLWNKFSPAFRKHVIPQNLDIDGEGYFMNIRIPLMDEALAYTFDSNEQTREISKSWGELQSRFIEETNEVCELIKERSGKEAIKATKNTALEDYFRNPERKYEPEHFSIHFWIMNNTVKVKKLQGDFGKKHIVEVNAFMYKGIRYQETITPLGVKAVINLQRSTPIKYSQDHYEFL